jgi:hypothetical protein
MERGENVIIYKHIAWIQKEIFCENDREGSLQVLQKNVSEVPTPHTESTIR